MYEPHFGLRENPFPGGHQLRFLYPSREHQEARAHLRYGIENREPFVLITGEVGTGKTTALYDALAEWGAQVSVALITNSALTRQELLEEICLRFGVALPNDSSKPKMLALLERHLTTVRSRGEYAVLLLDEAQNLEPGLLEEIRLLSNLETPTGEKLVQIFLVGQPELEAKLARPDLRQLRQRITVHYRLNPLSPDETAGYIHHRISVAGGNAWSTFPPDACGEVYRLTHGIPREINTVASHALLAAYAEGVTTVRPEHVRSAAHENEFRSVLGGGEAAELADTDTYEEHAAPPPPPAPRSAPDRARVEAAPEPPAPVWTPPEFTREREPRASAPAHAPAPPPAPYAAPPADVIERAEADAWTVAARDLLEARRRDAAAQSAAAAALPVENPEPASDMTPNFPTTQELLDRSQTADSGRADLSHLPPRLRERIETDIANPDAAKRSPLPLIMAVALVAAVGIALVLAQRFGVIDIPLLRGVGAASASNTSTAPGQAIVPAPQAAIAAALASRDSSAAAVRHARPASAMPPASSAPVKKNTLTAPAKPAEMRVYGIAVGAYLDRDRANTESARLSDATNETGRVVAYMDGSTTMYRIVIGNYTDQASAEASATELIRRNVIKEGRVLLLSRTTPRP